MAELSPGQQQQQKSSMQQRTQLSPAEKEAKRQQKAQKKAARAAQRIQNTMRSDARAHVRIAAAAESLAGGAIVLPLPPTLPTTAAAEPTTTPTAETTPTTEAKSGEALPTPPIAVSHCGLGWLEFSLELLLPPSTLHPTPSSSWLGITSLDLSHNELSVLPGLESLASLQDLNLCTKQHVVTLCILLFISRMLLDSKGFAWRGTLDDAAEPATSSSLDAVFCTHFTSLEPPNLY